MQIHLVLSNEKWDDFFRLTLENCKVCEDNDCKMNSLEMIKGACSDNTSLSLFMSRPLSSSTEVNQYINQINSEYSYQLAQMTLFQFPKSDQSKLLRL